MVCPPHPLSGMILTVMREADFSNLLLKYSLHQEIDDKKRGYTSIHCDYEEGKWNYQQFMTWIKQHIAEYALSPQEIREVRKNPTQFFEAVERASRMVYGSKAKTKKRGEIGEIILHGLIYDIYKTRPVISKIYLKTARNDTVKGFDCVHSLANEDVLESLWLGEAKFYKRIDSAITEAVESVKTLIDKTQLRNEFMVITNTIGNDQDPVIQQVKKLLHPSTSLDDIKPKICVPVLLTYESPVVNGATSIDQTFLDSLDKEVQAHLEKFMQASSGIDLDIHVFVFSLHQKQDLINEFDRQLKAHQVEA